jgi:hypothetical protein
MTNEEHWQLGNSAAYRAILLECAERLGAEYPLTKAAQIIAERRDAIAALRSFCERVGLPNDWPDDLHLADIIEKHIEKYWPEEDA